MQAIIKLFVSLGLCMVVVIFCVAQPTLADTLKSSNYQFTEQALGGTSLLNAQSTNYQATGSAALLGVGNSASASFQTNAGHETTNDPALALNITGASVNFGSFSPSAAAVATSTFQVLDYTSYGYAVQLLGSPPSNGGHTITAMATTGPSQAGVEQFGINLVANTSPVSVGANPNLGQFGLGVAASNYGTANSYRFVSGETIASAPKSSGTTTFTISYIVNVTDFTPGGQYATNQTLICTGTY